MHNIINFNPATCFFLKDNSQVIPLLSCFFQHFSISPGCGGYSGHLETERVGRLGWFHGQWLQWPQRSPATRGIWEGTIGELSSMMQDWWNNWWNMVEYWSESERFIHVYPFLLHCSWLLHDWQLPKSAKQLISARGMKNGRAVLGYVLPYLTTGPKRLVCVVRVIDMDWSLFCSSFAASTLKRFPGHIFWRLRATVFDASAQSQ